MKHLLLVLVLIATMFGFSSPVHASPAADQWHDLALEVGWTQAQWPWLACIIERESHGDPQAFNGNDPGYGSFGLTQLNIGRRMWQRWGWTVGFDMDQMFDPQVNLEHALDLYTIAARGGRGDGRSPWGRGCRR